MKPRRNNEARHCRFYEFELSSAAYRSLSPYARALLLEFKRRYNGSNNGGITFSLGEMREALNCSNKPASRALTDLQERGFVRLARKGSFDWKSRGEGGTRASTWVLTEFPIDLPQKSLMPPTKEFMSWREPAPEKKTRRDESTPLGVRRHPMSEGMGVSGHLNEGISSLDTAENEVTHGGISSPAYSLPGVERQIANGYARAKGGAV